ncbi:MAG TPA: asparagine synthase (glutamine-hydrolyzing), partial [Nitrospira sp.]|nr:asparagine synthase (glutamine-hydrolyzing) [Nitrospira sp.]
REPATATMLATMNQTLRHRGPDEDGFYRTEGAALAMRRLQVIDPAGGHQPLANEAETVWAVYNGEIYNFRELRADLVRRGHAFRTRSDTEVIVHAYEEFGEGCLDRFRGMFAFALWDSVSRRLLLARDRLGIKPLHYWTSGDQIAFASEIKALLRVPDVCPRLDERALDLYLTYGYIPSPHTIFRDIHKLPPAHYLIAERGRTTLQCYWDFAPADASTKSAREYSGELQERLRESVRAHLVSDVPLGAFLSGGLDSSTVVALMSKAMSAPVKTFSIGFRDGGYNELPYARMVADRYETDHHVLIVEPQAVKRLPELLTHFDEPFGDSSAIPTYLVAEFARRHVTVVLTGDGGDEMFGGYEWQRRYLMTHRLRVLPLSIRRQLPFLTSVIAAPVSYRARLEKVRNFLLDAASSAEDGYVRRLTLFDSSARALLYSPDLRGHLNGWNSQKALRSWVQRLPTTDFRNRMLYADTHFYCPEDCLTKVDRMTMAWSLEARVPLLDHTFVEFMASIPPDFKLRGLTSKYLLRQAVGDLLPAPLLAKRKQGFSIPLGAWLRGPLRVMLCDTLLGDRVRRRGWLRPETMERMINQHITGERDHAHRLWALLALELWAGEYIDHALAQKQVLPSS